MKNLIYLFAAVTMFAFTACGGGETATEEAVPADIVAAEAAEDAAPIEDVADTAAAEEATEETAE